MGPLVYDSYHPWRAGASAFGHRRSRSVAPRSLRPDSRVGTVPEAVTAPPAIGTVSSSDSGWLRLRGFPARTFMWFGWERGCLFGLVDAPDLESAWCLYCELHARARAPNNSHFDVVADSNRIAEPSREGNHDVISP
jgi:hypothetical protein